MVVGILQVQLTIEHARSLKDKRRVVSSIKDRLHREQHVSVAEVDAHDIHNQAMIGVALASSSVSHCQSVMDHVLNKIRHQRDCVISDHTIQILTGT